MIISEIKKIDSSLPKLREFGLLVGGIAIVMGDWLLWRGRGIYPYFLFSGAFLAAAGAIFPAVLLPFQKAWMTLAILMGWVMTRVITALLFFVTVTPISLILKLTGKDLLDIKLDAHAPSYWKLRPKTSPASAEYERQF